MHSSRVRASRISGYQFTCIKSVINVTLPRFGSDELTMWRVDSRERQRFAWRCRRSSPAGLTLTLTLINPTRGWTSPTAPICVFKRSVLQWDRRSQNKHCQNCYNEITFRDWSTRLFQQFPLYDLRLTRSSKTRSVISLLAEVPSWDRLNLSYRV